MKAIWIIIQGCALVLTSALCSRQDHKSGDISPQAVALAKQFALDEAIAQKDLATMTAKPHPFGSPEQEQVARWLVERAKEIGLEVRESSFTAETPNPALLDNPNLPAPATQSRGGKNILAWPAWATDKPCMVILASHYDTKEVPGISYVGANDSGSSTAALLQIMRFLQGSAVQESKPSCGFMAIWFDGEESILPNWHDGQQRHPARMQDNTYGSRHEAGRLTACTGSANQMCLPKELGAQPIRALILMDMIGAPQVRLIKELHSTGALLEQAIMVDQALFPNNTLFQGSHSTAISDDHEPFLAKGVPALDLIDFHHTEVWHQDGDDVSRLSMESIARVSQLAIGLGLELAFQ